MSFTPSPLGSSNPVPIDFTSRDYTSILADLINAIPSFLPEWTSQNVSSFGVALLELFAYVEDIEQYYIDRIANEAFLATAQQRSSILNLAYLIDYAPGDATPSEAALTITLNPNTPQFVLPAGTLFSTQATSTSPAVVFQLTSTHTVQANTGSTSLPITQSESGAAFTVSQGTPVTGESVGTSSGNASQQFTLFNTGVVVASIQIYVNESSTPGAGNLWNVVSSLSDSGPYDATYAIAEDANGVIYIIFGDGVNGRVPNPSATITANYTIGGGAFGNVGANQIVVNLSNISEIASVTNPAAAVGGADAETIPQIQVNAPKSLTAAGRCVSEQDYASVSLAVSGVAKASAVASASAASVNLYVHPVGGPFTVASLGSQVTALAPLLTWGGPGPLSSTGASGYLDSRKQVGTSVSVLPPTVVGGGIGYVQIVIGANIQVLPTYTQAQVEQSVLAALVALFDFGSMAFGQRLTLSSVYHAIQSVGGVDYATVTSMYRSDLSPGLGDIVCAPSELAVVTDPDTGLSQLTLTMAGGL